MASTTHEIAFELAANSVGLQKTFSAASKAMSGFNKELIEVNKQAAQVDKVIRLRNELDALEKQIAETENPTKALTDKLEKKRAALAEVEKAAGTAGQSMDDLAARQEKLKTAAEQATKAQEKLAKATELQQKFKDMAKSGAMGMASTAAAAAPLVLTVKAAMDFEDMQAEIGKFTDDAAGVFNGIKNLTGKYSKSAADMTAMATNAMQSGIAKTTEDVLRLVESQTQAAVAFGMTGDAVGEAWASIQSKMGTSVAETEAVFDIVNKLGNETSASSEDILNVLQRQGGAVKSLTALNEKQIAAMAGAFRSASTSSEVAATSMGTFIGRLTVGEAATKKQRDAFEALGLDAEDVAKRMTSSSESAEATIQDVFARINSLSKDKQAGIIGNLFGNEAGIKSAVATLSAQGKLLGDNLKMVGDSANYSGSMFKEYMARANTTSEALGIAKNQITTIAASIGQSLLPTVKSLMTTFIPIAQKVAAFIENNKELVAGITKTITVILAAKLAFHGMQMVVGLIGSPIMGLVKGFRSYQAILAQANAATAAGTALTLKQKAAMLVSAVATKVAAAAQYVLNSAFWACPITWIVAGIAAVVAAGILLYKNWDKVKAAAQTLWSGIVSCWNGIKSATAKAWSVVVGWISKVKNKAIELWKTFQQKFPMISRIVQIAAVPIKIAIQLVINIFKLLKAAGIALWNGLKWCWNGIKSATVTAWNAIKQPLINAWNKFKEFAGYVKSGFVSAFQAFRSKVASIFSGLVGIVKSPLNAVIRLVNKAIGAINKINVKIPDWAGGGSLGFNIPKIPQLAQGGIATAPTLAIIGEGRESEAVLPLSKLQSMIGGGTGGGTITVNFAPVINVSGGSGNIAGDVERGLQAGVDNLEKALEKLLHNKQRLSFG